MCIVAGDKELPGVSRRDHRLFLAIVLVALAIRIVYVVDIADSPYFNHPVLDSFWYDAKASDVSNGDVLATSGSFRVPLYVYFVAGCYLVFGHGYLAPILIQAFLGALTCGLIFVIGKRLFGRLAGFVAGLGFAFYRMAIYSDGELLPTTLFILLMMAAFYFVVKGIDGRRMFNGLLAGLFMGLGFLTRPDILPFAAAIAIAVLVLLGAKTALRFAGAMVTVLVAFMLLLGLRNLVAFGEFYVFSPQGAINLYIGNAGFADGKTPLAPGTRFPYHIVADPSEDSITLACKQAAKESVGRELSDRELSGYYIRKSVGEIGGDIPRWLTLIVKKAYFFLNSYERSDIKLIPRFTARYSGLLKLPLVSYVVVMPLGVAGLLLSILRHNRRVWVASAGFFAYGLVSVVFFVIWRYRLPAVPFLMILSGYAVSEAYLACRHAAYRTVAFLAVVALGLGVLSASRLWGVSEEEWEGQYIVNEGALFMKAGRHEEATELYLEAIESQPSDPRSYFYLGKAYGARGMFDQARQAMETAMTLSSTYKPFAYLTLGVALANKGEFGAAVTYFETALEADSDLGLAAYNLGLSKMNLGDYEGAEKAFTRAEFLCRDDIEALVGMARAFVRMGRYERGIVLAQNVLRQDPHNAEGLYAMGLGLEAVGRTDEALGYFERALRYLPASQEIRQKIGSLRARHSTR